MWTSRNWGASLMPGPADVLGPILEMMTWVGFVPGIPLLVAGYVMAKNRCLWISTTAEVFRWSDGKNTPHLSLRPAGETQGLEPDSEVVLHYDACHPARWRLDPQRHDNTVMTMGWILTTVGIVCTVAGVVRMMF